MNNKELFENAPVGKAVAKMAIPTIITMLVVVIYNMADTFFIGQTGDAMQVAAVSLATPVFMVFMALGNLFGIGGSSAISRALGSKSLERAKKICSFCCYGSLGLGIIIFVCYLGGMNMILKLIGATENTIGFAREYLTIIAVGGPFIMFATAFGNILRGEGAAKESMIGNMIGTLTNIVLDPIMILGLGMGVSGAAWATVIGNVAASAFYVVFFLRKKSILSISPKEFSMKGGIATDVIKIGIPASLNNILMSVSNIVLNNALIQYGDTPVAAMGVALKTNMLVVLLQIGLCAGIQPLIGYNYGAKNYKRLNSIFKFTGICAIVMGTILTVVIFFTKAFIIKAFINDAEVVRIGTQMVIALQISGPIIGLLFLSINTLQGMGKAIPSLILTVCRQGIMFIPMIYILNALFKMDGVIYAQSVADYGSIILGIVICLIILKKAESTGKPLYLNRM
ncbi:MAG: MATE family efflux transporter [Lachnospiraceae bacterium]|nr:MATE family efflux transporter [Lachnospiraceae bacterium]